MQCLGALGECNMDLKIAINQTETHLRLLEASGVNKITNFDLLVEASEWYSHLHTDNYHYRALSATQPDAQQILDTKIVPAGSWCSDNIYTAAQFIKGYQRLPTKGDVGIIAVFVANVKEVDRDHIRVKHYKTLSDEKVHALLKVKII